MLGWHCKTATRYCSCPGVSEHRQQWYYGTGNGLVAGILSQAEEGVYMGFGVSRNASSLAIGFIRRRVLSQFLRWTSAFWLSVIMSVACLVPLPIAFPGDRQTYPWNGLCSTMVDLQKYLKPRKSDRGAVEIAGDMETNIVGRRLTSIAAILILASPMPRLEIE